MNEKTFVMFGLCGLLLSLVLISGTVNAAVPSQGFISIEKEEQNPNVLDVGILVAEPVVQTDGFKAALEGCKNQPDYAKCVADVYAYYSNKATAPQISSIENAEFMLTYFNPVTNTWSVVPGCEKVIANERKSIEYYGTPVDYYYGKCTVDKALYKGIRITVRATLIGGIPSDMNIYAPYQETELSDIQTSPAVMFATMLTNLVTGIISGGNVNVQCPPSDPRCIGATSLPCLGVFLILGLLLASMYFSGKSPITLLDITTPRLPAPKGITASGQVVLPYGYGEMKASLGKKIASAASAASATSAYMGKSMPYDKELEGMRRKVKETVKKYGGGKEETDMLESIATAGRWTGKSEKDMASLLSQLPAHYGDAEHKVLSEILGKLNGMGEREKLMASAIKDYMLSVRTMKTLDALSGHPDIGKRSALHYKIQKTLGTLTGAGRYGGGVGIGALFGGSVDSAVRTFRVVGRGTKAMVQFAPTLGREVAKTTMTMIGGERALERLEKEKPAVAAWLKKPPKTIEIGQMAPINEKMAHLYNVVKEEVLRDEMKYVIKQMYKNAGVNFAITEEGLARMGREYMDILEISGYNKNMAKIKQFEPEMIKILSANISPAEKLEQLVALAKKQGAVIDTNMLQFNDRIAAIEGSAEAAYLKFLKLSELLAQHEKAIPAAAAGQVMEGDRFYTVVGRSSIAGSDLWETMVLRYLIKDAEKGTLASGAGLKEELLAAWLRTINRTDSLRVEDPALQKRINAALGELLTENGKQVFKQFNQGKNITDATLDEHAKVLYSGEQKAPKTYEVVDRRTGVRAYWGEAKEMGALPGAYKVGMDEVWTTEVTSRTLIPIRQWVAGRFARSYIDPYDAVVEANLNRMPGSAHWTIEERTAKAKEEWAKKLIREDMEQRFNSEFALNAYGKFRESSAFYVGVAAGFLQKALTDKGLPEDHPDLMFVRTLDSSNVNQLKRLRELLSTYKSDYEAVLSRKVTYDDIVTSKQAIVMLYEGGFAYAHKNMPLSSADRVYGTVVIRDEKGQKREFAPESVVIDFRKFGREDLQMEFNKVRESKDPHDWTAFMEGVVKWAKSGGYNYEKEKMLAAIVWEYGNNTNDYQKYYSKTSLEIVSKREAIPLAPDALRMFGIEGGKVAEMLKPWHDIKNAVGDYIGRFSYVAGGPVYRASYDITPVSEYLRQHSWRIAANVFTKDPRDLTAAERAAYEKFASTHFSFHHVWVWTIDRNPWRHSSSHGLQQAMDSYFNYGPRSTYPAEDYLKATMSDTQWKMFKYGPYGLLLNVARRMHQIPASMFGGMQMAMQGYPARMDQTGNPLKPSYETPPRILEALQSLNPFSFEWGTKGGKITSKLNVWEGSLQRRQLAGPDIMQGVVQAPQDIFGKRVGAFAVARFGEANPGASLYTYGYHLKLDPAMAEWLIRNRDAVYMYDQEVKEQAYSNTMRRTVSMEALAIRRAQEMRHFGILQNSIYAFANPVFAMWHGLPFTPPSLTLKEQVMKMAQRARSGRGMNLGQSMEDLYQRAANITTRVMHPSKAKLVSYCRKCGRPGYKGQKCICGGFIYGE